MLLILAASADARAGRVVAPQPPRDKIQPISPTFWRLDRTRRQEPHSSAYLLPTLTRLVSPGHTSPHLEHLPVFTPVHATMTSPL